MGRVVRRTALVSLLVALCYAIWRGMQRRHAERGVEWESAPFPFPPVPRPPASSGEPSAEHVEIPGGVQVGGGPETEATHLTEQPWIEPIDGECPDSHPVKAKLASGIFHVRGGANYERTKPDRCYCDTDAAQADGLRASKN